MQLLRTIWLKQFSVEKATLEMIMYVSLSVGLSTCELGKPSKKNCGKQAKNGLQSRSSEYGSVALWIAIAVILHWR